MASQLRLQVLAPIAIARGSGARGQRIRHEPEPAGWHGRGRRRGADRGQAASEPDEAKAKARAHRDNSRDAAQAAAQEPSSGLLAEGRPRASPRGRRPLLLARCELRRDRDPRGASRRARGKRRLRHRERLEEQPGCEARRSSTASSNRRQFSFSAAGRSFGRGSRATTTGRRSSRPSRTPDGRRAAGRRGESSLRAKGRPRGRRASLRGHRRERLRRRVRRVPGRRGPRRAAPPRSLRLRDAREADSFMNEAAKALDLPGLRALAAALPAG